MMNNKGWYIGCLFSLWLSACESMLFDDLDNVADKNAPLEYFSIVRIEDCFDVFLTQDSVYGINVTAPFEFLDNVIYRLNEDTLILMDRNRMKAHVSYPRPVITVSAPRFNRIEAVNPANIYSKGILTQESLVLYTTQHAGIVNLDLDVDRFRLLAGATRNLGEFFITGKAQNAFFWMRSYTRLDASRFVVDQINIRNNSVSDSFVHPLDSLSVGITSIGNVYYYGEPRKVILKYQNASGQLIPLNGSKLNSP